MLSPAEGLQTLSACRVTTVYILPDCSGPTREAVVAQCTEVGIVAQQVQLSIFPADVIPVVHLSEERRDRHDHLVRADFSPSSEPLSN